MAPHADGTGASSSPSVELGQVARSSVWSLAGQILVVCSALLATPFTVRLLGSELFGVVALVQASVAFLGFADLGMGVASTRFGAQALARQDDAEEVAVVWTALTIGVVLSGTVATAFLFLSPVLVDRVLDIPDHLRGDAVVALRLAGLGFVARVIAGIMNTSQLIRLRWDLYTLVTTVTGVGQILLVPVVVALGGGVVAAIMVGVCSSLLAAILHFYNSFRLQPLLIRPAIRTSLAPPLFRFGGALLLSSVAAAPLTVAERFFLARFASVRAVGHYALAATLASTIAIVPAAISQPLIPAFTNMLARRRPEEAQRLSKLAIQSAILAIMPSVLVLWLVIPPLLSAWVGSEFAAASTLPFYILSGGLVMNSLAFVPANLIIADGRADLIARLHLLELAPFLLGAGLLTAHFGTAGAAAAWSLRVSADTVLLFVMARSVTGIKPTAFGAKRWPYTITLLLLFGPYIVSAIVGMAFPAQVLIVACCVAAHIALVRRSVLTAEERDALKALVRKIIARLRPQPDDDVSRSGL